MWSHYITAAQAKQTVVFTLPVDFSTAGINYQCEFAISQPFMDVVNMDPLKNIGW